MSRHAEAALPRRFAVGVMADGPRAGPGRRVPEAWSFGPQQPLPEVAHRTSASARDRPPPGTTSRVRP